MTNDETQDVDFTQALEDYLDQHEYNMPRTGDIRRGIIVDISDEGIIVDLGLKRDGLVPPSDLGKLSDEERAALHVDQEIPVYISSAGDADSLQVSVHRAYLNEDWIKAQDYLETGEVIQATVVGYNRGGALVEYGRLRGFVPLSQLSAFRPGMPDREKQRMLSKLRDEELPLKVIEVDRRRRRLVMSNREAQKEWLSAKRAEILESLNAGDVIEGRVSSLRDFGAFVDIGDGIEGLVHVSELAWYRIDHPREVIKVGDEFEVYVLKVDKDAQRISLSRKRLLPDPWSTIEDRYDVGQLVEGRITRIVDYGAFVEIEPGIEGLLHVSKLSRGEVSNPREVVREEETHLLRIISIDPDRQRIGLSLKAVTQQEQIDWMMEKEAAAAASDEESEEAEEAEEGEATAELAESEPTAEESVEETSEEVEESSEESEPEAEESAEESEATATAEAAESEPTAEESVEETEEVEEAAEESEPVAEESAEETSEEVTEEASSEEAEEPAEETEADEDVEEPAAEETSEAEPGTADENVTPAEEAGTEIEPEAESEDSDEDETETADIEENPDDGIDNEEESA